MKNYTKIFLALVLFWSLSFTQTSEEFLDMGVAQTTKAGKVFSSAHPTSTPAAVAQFKSEQSRDTVLIHYDGPYDNNGIGLTAGGTFLVAARFTPTELGPYYGSYVLKKVRLVINDSFTSVTLKVWEGGSLGNSGTEIYSQDIGTLVNVAAWTSIDLTTPIPLAANNA